LALESLRSFGFEVGAARAPKTGLEAVLSDFCPQVARTGCAALEKRSTGLKMKIETSLITFSHSIWESNIFRSPRYSDNQVFFALPQGQENAANATKISIY